MKLDRTALILLVIGVVGAEGLTLYFIRHNQYFTMQLLFGAWVLAPFAVLTIARFLTPSSGLSRMTLNLLTILITTVTLVVFTYANLRGPTAQAAFPFIALPAVSVLVVLLVVIVGVVKMKR